MRTSAVQMMSNIDALEPGALVVYERWQDWDADYSMGPSRFDGTVAHPIMFKIGDRIFTEWSEEFIELYRKVYIWEALTQ